MRERERPKSKLYLRWLKYGTQLAYKQAATQRQWCLAVFIIVVVDVIWARVARNTHRRIACNFKWRCDVMWWCIISVYVEW